MAYNAGKGFKTADELVAGRKAYDKAQADKKIADALKRQQKEELKLEPVSASRNQDTFLRKKRKREGTLLVDGINDANTAPSAFGGQKTLLGE